MVTGVHRDHPNLVRSLAGVRHQTYQRWRHVVVLNGADAAASRVVDRHGDLDERVVVVESERQLGPVGAIHRGLDACRGRWLAVVDSDDVVEPHRLAAQVEFLDDHPNVDVVGGGWWEEWADGRTRQVAPPTNPDEVWWRLNFECPILHSAALVRWSSWERHGGHRRDKPLASDYDLWLRIGQDGRLANLAMPVVTAHRGESRTSQEHLQPQVAEVLMTLSRHYSNQLGRRVLPNVAQLLLRTGTVPAADAAVAAEARQVLSALLEVQEAAGRVNGAIRQDHDRRQELLRQ